MSQFTTAWYNAQLAKQAVRDGGFGQGAVCREAKLHADILEECRSRGWIAFHGSMAHSTFRTEGEPDFVILRPGSVLLVECKSATGKLTWEQLGIQAWAKRLGHTVHVVRSLEEFLRL